jgi:hypothetical protein
MFWMTGIREIREAPGYYVDAWGNVYSARRGGLKKLRPSPSNKGYLQFKAHCIDRVLAVHRCVAKAFLPGPMLAQVDHINRDRKDNRASNLRWASDSSNKVNTSSRPGSSSSYLGVTFCKTKAKWRARVRLNGREIHAGYFSDEREAAKARDRMVKKMHGEYAALNFRES